MYHSIEWSNNSLSILNQKALPENAYYYTYSTFAEILNAIEDKKIIGDRVKQIAGCYALALSVNSFRNDKNVNFKDELLKSYQQIVTISEDEGRILKIFKKSIEDISGSDCGKISEKLIEVATKLFDQEHSIDSDIIKKGNEFIHDKDIILTSGNSGKLSSGSKGTALGIIKEAQSSGKNISVYLCESRPSLYGARLASWELLQEKVPVNVITDNMASSILASGKVSRVILSADYYCDSTKEVLTTVGNLNIAIAAKYYNVPVIMTVIREDSMDSGDSMLQKISEGDIEDIAYFNGSQIVPEGVFISSLKYDKVPYSLISELIRN